EARVDSTPINVDLPAPFGPRRPTMSPAASVIETCDRARRRPKWRETSVSWTESKSTVARTTSAGSGRGGRLGREIVAVEGAVDLLERHDHFLAARRVAAIVDAAAAPLLLEPDQLVEQLVSPR